MYKILNYKKNIDFIEIDNGLNLRICLSNFGAGVYSIYYDNNLMTLTLKEKEDYLFNPCYFGKTLGVVAGRLPVDGYLNNGEAYHLLDTGNGLDLHGGDLKSLSFKSWKYKIKENENEIRIVFSIKTKDKENGFLGSALIKVAYIISKKDNKFKIKFNGKINKDCLLNLSNHIYWNFKNSKDLNGYSLKVNADRDAVMNENLLHIGIEEVPAYIDFRRMKSLKSSMNFIERNISIGTIDNTFLFENNKKGNVILKNDEFLIKLKTNYPAMNIYVDNSLRDFRFLNRNDLAKRRGIALEPQLFGFDRKSICFEKGDKYNYELEYKIIKE